MLEENNVKQIEEDENPLISIQSKQNKQLKQKYQTEVCRVLWSKLNSFAISFKGFGILIPTDHKITESEIEVKYIGTIGETDFKIL